MFRLYSKGCEYAIKALVHVSEIGGDSNFTAKQICRKARIPEAFSRKVFQSLVKARYLRAVPGNLGGYRLAKDPNQVSILEIVKAVDGEDTFDHCVMGSSAKCSGKNACPMHETWKHTKERLLSSLELKRLINLRQVYQSGKGKK